MVYRVAGILNKTGAALTVAMVEFEVNGKNWTYQIAAQQSYPLTENWQAQLAGAASLPVKDYLHLHAAYGKLMSATLQQFIEEYQLHYRVQLIACPGYAVFDELPFTLGDAGTVAALTGINTVSDFYAMNAALGATNRQLQFNQLQITDDADAQMIEHCFYAVLRWREENNFLADGSGAQRSSIGGAVWIGQEW